MPKIYPFKALRPLPDYIGKVSAKSSDFGNQNLLAEEIRSNPFTFHHVTKNHMNYSGAFQEPEKFLPFAARFVQEMKSKEILIKEKEDSFYLYEQTRSNGRKFKGIIALCHLDDYKNNNIKKHEEIRPSRLRFLEELFKTTKVMGEPTLLAYKDKVAFNLSNALPLYSFTSVDSKHHAISRISDPQDIKEIQSKFESIASFYIADGHHRSASVEKFHSDYPELDNSRSMCFIVQEDELDIKPFQRLIKPVMKWNVALLKERLSQKFDITELDDHLYDPLDKGQFGLYIDKKWFQLTVKGDNSKMDILILEDEVVKGIFEIEDSRTDSQISFHPHTDGLTTLVNLVDSGTFDVAFTSKPCTFSEVRRVSDESKTLPAKSTYIEPKLRSGMIIQEFI